MLPLWSPSPERIADANITAYASWLGETRSVEIDGYESLWRWSVAHVDDFWASIFEYYDVQIDGDPRPVLGNRTMPGATWFPRSRINYAEHIFRCRHPDSAAIHYASEAHELATWSWRELRARTAAIAGGLQRLGVGEGDRVAGYLPNLPETVAAFLACASLGATWTSCSPDFGARTVVDRFAQVEPKVLLYVDAYRYGGRDHDRHEVVDQITAALPGLQHAIRLGYLDATGWQSGFEDSQHELGFARVPFDHPLWILFSSGTTGPPKAIVHGQGGVLLEQLKSGHLHLDAHRGDRVLWFTTTGWMMWNLLVGVLLTPAEIVLFDGNPGHPDLGTLWALAAEARVTTFGTSAAFVGVNQKAGLHPAREYELSSVRSVGSTGSPLSPEGFHWILDELGSDIWLFSMSGGTDVCTAFVGGVPTLPVYEGEIQARALGCDVQAWDENGRPLVGEVGELVIVQPMPSMPTGFWNDPAGERYAESYFEHYPGVWRHGDWIRLLPSGSCVIHGRSDSTINRGGIRMGTAEIYRALLALDEITDALVVDLPLPQHPDGWMPLFVVLRDGVELDDNLERRIRAAVRTECSPRHVPNEIRVVAEIPRTLSGKALEVPVKRILMGGDPDKVVSPGSLANPSALEPFVSLAFELGSQSR